MESPVRICLGAALVVNLLLLSSTPANGGALPPELTSTTVKDEITPKYGRINNTWTVKSKPTSPDISINELKPKDSTSEEHTEKNAKYKDRGRVRYFSEPKTATESPLKRIQSIEAPKLVIVTPTPETKKPIDIIDSMHTFKKTKLPVLSSTPVTVSKEESDEEAYDDEEDEEDTESFEKFASTKFDNFFSMPSYTFSDDFTRDSDNESSDNKVNKNEYNSPTYGGFSRLFPGESSYGYKDTTHDVFKSESFFSFDSDLTTPKNDYFDEKFQRISTSILKNLDTIKVTAPPANTSTTNVHKIVKENVNMEKVGNNTPSNRSTVFIKNTKEIRLLDNDGASSANKGLSDVQGTSIYYEMSVLSTETYAINSDDDCEDSLIAEPTVSTSSEEELATLKSTNQQKPIATVATIDDSYLNTVKPTLSDLDSKTVKQTSPKSKPETGTKSSRIERIKSTPDYESKANKSTLSSQKFNTVKTTSLSEKSDSDKTTSSSMRRESARSTSTTQRVVSRKSTLSKFERIKPTLSDSSAESAKPIISNLRFETAKPTTSIRFKDTIPNLIFDTTVNPTFPSPTFEAIKPTYPDPNMESVSISSTDILPLTSVLPIFNSINSIPISTQNVILPSDQTLKPLLSSYTRNRSYSKRLNLTASKDSLNSVTPKAEVSINLRNYTRKFYQSTPRNKPTWMTPRRNVTKSFVKPTHPTTIYSEHFSMKDKYKKLTTVQPRLPYKTVLTTISSNIDPVLETDVEGKKKIIHSQSIADNTVPSLWKRGSTKFGTSTSASTEVDTEGEWQIPPTSAVWALASLRSPPPSPNVATNATKMPQKSVDEKELQKSEEVTDGKLASSDEPIVTTTNLISNDIIPKKVTEVYELPSKTILALRTPSTETQTEEQNEIKSETLPAESNNISAQSSADPVTTDAIIAQNQTESWVQITTETDITNKNEYNKETVPSVDSTNSTRFESITKLPSGVTTPQDETVASSEVNQTVADEKPLTTAIYPVTTIRFSYVPTEEIETETQPEDITPTTWHPVYPTRTRITPVKDTPITTYRPKYTTTTEAIDESTTMIPENTSRLEVSSQVLENSAKLLPVTTEMLEPTTTILPTTTDLTAEPATTEITSAPTTVEATTQPTTITITTEPITTGLATEPTTIQASKTLSTYTTLAPTTLPSTTEEVEDTTTIVVQLVTEINTEKERIITSTTTQPETTETPPSELFNTDCTEESSGNNEIITDETPITTTTTKATTTTTRMTTTEAATPTSNYRTSTEVIEDTTSVSEEPTTTEFATELPETTQPNAKIIDTTLLETTTDMNYVTKSINELEDLTSYAGEVTTKASFVTMNGEDTGSGAGVAIAVSTIGVIALILLIGLLLVVRRRGRRGVYAQRCTPVSLDAYSLDSVSVGHRKGNHRLRASKRSYGNPAYDDEVTSHPMQYAALANFALDIESMTSEFAEIPSVSVRPEEVPPGCEDKNRYSNVLPLPETRVPLKRIGNDPTTEYINANYVTGPGNIRNYYIACQAPLSNTVVDFWRMIWEQNSRLIVMLTEYMENGVEKCYEYLPPSEISDNKRTFGEFKIILKKREQRDKYAVSSVQLINLATRTWREITHLWYFWPAKGVPDDYDSIIDFLCEMRSYMKISQTAKEYDEEGVEVIYGDQNGSSFNNLSKLREESGAGYGTNVYSPARAEEQMRRTVSNNGTLGRLKAASEAEGIRPCVVTCASGAGRSAALIALDVVSRALPAAADVPRVVRQLRAQRPHSLANRHHYIFVYKVLSEYGNKMLGGGVDTL